MSTKQTLWQLLVTNPLVQIAAIVTILVGLLSILKDTVWPALHWKPSKSLAIPASAKGKTKGALHRC